MANKYRWEENTNDIVSAVCVYLTSLHILYQPLRMEYSNYFELYFRIIYAEGPSLRFKSVPHLVQSIF